MPEDTASNLTLDHITAFGAIINLCAKIENQMQITMAGIVGLNLGTTMVFTAGLSYLWKRDVLKNLNAMCTLPNDANATLNDLINEFDQFQQLRNVIAHSIWTNGTRCAAVKPMRLKIRSGKPVAVGVEDTERDYTHDELWAEAKRLNALSQRFSEMWEKTGLADKIEENIEAALSASATRPRSG